MEMMQRFAMHPNLREMVPESFSHGPQIQRTFSTITAAFYHHAITSPDISAARDLSVQPAREITYEQLARRAIVLSQRLRHIGVGPGDRVPLLVKRGIDMLVGIVAVLTCGAQYVPLDAGIVADSTLRFVVEQTGGRTALVLRSTQHRLQGSSVANVLVIDDVQGGGDELNAQDALSQDLATPDQGCYVIYTSGTTGTPKGVDVTHQNVTNLICTNPGNLSISCGDRVGQVLNIGFDMAAWEILGSLCNGGTLILRGSDWRQALKQIDILICTPSILAKYEPQDFPDIRVVATAGEPSNQRLADKWASNGTYYNCCGPTETTIVNTMHKCASRSPTAPPVAKETRPLCIGTPTPNNTVYILDQNLSPVGFGEAGIMWAGGLGVSRGYVGLPEKTAEKYRIDPFKADGSMMYNTGDVCRWARDGSVEILGRMDDQVKVKGFRVELDGVSTSLNSCAVVESGIALLIDGEIHGFVAPLHSNIEVVKEQMKSRQPYYAIPSQFHLVDCLPLTANGKIDKKGLREIATRSCHDLHVVEKFSHSPSSSISSTVTEVASISDMSVTPKAAMVKKISHSQSTSISSSITAVMPCSEITFAPKAKLAGKSISHIQHASISSSITEVAPPSVVYSSSENEEKLDLEAAIPEKHLRKPLRGLRHRIAIVYRRLFTLVSVLNIIAVIALVITGINREWLGNMTAANLALAVLVRQELVINALYTITCSVPKSWPLCIRTRCAKIYHLGGAHSGAAVCAGMWLLASNISDAVCMTTGCSGWGHQSLAAKIVAWMLILGFVVMFVMAYPTIRKKYHDTFEKTHRFMGWTMLALFWVQVVLTVNDGKVADMSLGNACARSPPFWLLLVASMSIASSWLFLRKVPVEAEVLSDHAIRLHFDYTVPVNGSFTRLSRRPLMEWHSFATIPAPEPVNNRAKGYSLVVSNAGDWTKHCIQNPPTHLWVRGIPTCGVMRIATLFKRVVVIATGSGIGPLLGHIQNPSCATQLIWSTAKPEKTFGEELCSSIRAKIPGAVIHDTKVLGRPDLVKMGYNLVKSFEAEAVIIIANEKITKKVVYGLETRGVPAYGAIWDS